jgi:cytochrome P450
MGSSDLPSCLCKRGAKCDKFSPPSIGTGYFQDKSLEAAWNVDSFVRRNLEGNEHRVFLTRMLMKPCFVVCKNKLVGELLEDRNENFYNLLKDFFFGLFGDAMVFAPHDLAVEYRRLLLPLFSDEAAAGYEGILDETTDFMFQSRIKGSGTMEMYEEFKRLSLAYNLRIFLDINENETPGMG